MTFSLGKKRAGLGVLGTVVVILVVLFFLGFLFR
jgi:hypothetical protein